MNYDRLILELMERVSALEEDVASLKKLCSESEQSAAMPEDVTLPQTQRVDFKHFTAMPKSKPVVSFFNDGRDTTKYMFNGVVYCKNRFVLAVVKEYMKNNPDISANMLMTVFDRSLQGSLGVVRTLADVKSKYMDYERRFFCRPNEIIHTATDDCVVCTQWGVGNIGKFIERIGDLGMGATPIN